MYAKQISWDYSPRFPWCWQSQPIQMRNINNGTRTDRRDANATQSMWMCWGEFEPLQSTGEYFGMILASRIAQHSTLVQDNPNALIVEFHSWNSWSKLNFRREFLRKHPLQLSQRKAKLFGVFRVKWILLHNAIWLRWWASGGSNIAWMMTGASNARKHSNQVRSALVF